jgi:hypothetical protein
MTASLNDLNSCQLVRLSFTTQSTECIFRKQTRVFLLQLHSAWRISDGNQVTVGSADFWYATETTEDWSEMLPETPLSRQLRLLGIDPGNSGWLVKEVRLVSAGDLAVCFENGRTLTVFGATENSWQIIAC